MGLATASLLYRRPDLYDALTTPDTATICALAAAHRPTAATSLLDLGCGTGSFLASLPIQLARRVGIDVQPGMVAYARAMHPELDVRVADIRSVRLGERFDVVTCIGMSLAYLLELRDLAAGVGTIAAHTHESSVVVIHTLTAPVDATETTTTVAFAEHSATVTTRYQWQEPLVLMHRRWRLDDGSEHSDLLCRRVWSIERLRSALRDAGLCLVAGAGPYLVARRYRMFR